MKLTFDHDIKFLERRLSTAVMEKMGDIAEGFVEKENARLLAFLMGTHARVGGDSVLKESQCNMCDLLPQMYPSTQYPGLFCWLK
jgi:hypothetical protein